jgi:hypothetical protein
MRMLHYSAVASVSLANELVYEVRPKENPSRDVHGSYCAGNARFHLPGSILASDFPVLREFSSAKSMASVRPLLRLPPSECPFVIRWRCRLSPRHPGRSTILLSVLLSAGTLAICFVWSVGASLVFLLVR